MPQRLLALVQQLGQSGNFHSGGGCSGHEVVDVAPPLVESELERGHQALHACRDVSPGGLPLALGQAPPGRVDVLRCDVHWHLQGGGVAQQGVRPDGALFEPLCSEPVGIPFGGRQHRQRLVRVVDGEDLFEPLLQLDAAAERVDHFLGPVDDGRQPLPLQLLELADAIVGERQHLGVVSLGEGLRCLGQRRFRLGHVDACALGRVQRFPHIA